MMLALLLLVMLVLVLVLLMVVFAVIDSATASICSLFSSEQTVVESDPHQNQ